MDGTPTPSWQRANVVERYLTEGIVTDIQTEIVSVL